jgi:hypothetical protein
MPASEVAQSQTQGTPGCATMNGVQQNQMNRNEVIKKIQAILKLQNNTTFEGEAQNAARMIDKLCREYNISFEEATQVQVLD